MAIAADSVTIPTSKVFSQELPTIFAQHLTDWMKGSDPVTILVTGKDGSGKSTLINCLLNAAKAPVRKGLTKPKASALKSYESVLGKIKLTVWEIPADLAADELKKCSKNAHLILFCVNMSEMRYNEEEKYESMSQLSQGLGIDIFKRTMFILTFANNYIDAIEDDHLNNPTEMKKEFVDTVDVWKISLQSTLEHKIGLDRDSAQKTKAVPVGRGEKKCSKLLLFPDDDLDWLSKLWREAIPVNPLVTPSVAKLYDHQVISQGGSQSKESSVSFSLHLGENFSLKLISSELDTPDIKG